MILLQRNEEVLPTLSTDVRDNQDFALFIYIHHIILINSGVFVPLLAPFPSFYTDSQDSQFCQSRFYSNMTLFKIHNDDHV
jgi:hypothetical protein